MTFEAIPTGTRVTILHVGLPITHVERHAAGWTQFLGVLACVADGGTAPSENLPDID